MQLTVASMSLHWQAAMAAARTAAETTEGLGIWINVAMVDRAGTPMAFLRMHGAPLHSIDIAENKAYTAASFGLSRAEWDAVMDGNEALRAGLPIMHAGECVGGIGVSGSREEQDEACAGRPVSADGGVAGHPKDTDQSIRWTE